MRILLLGENGQLGQQLRRTLPLLGEVKACGRADVDFTDHNSITAAIEAFQPDVIVNAAAYTAVDRAEKEQKRAFQVNADAVALLAEQSAKHGIWLIHYSTDYVFDGSKAEPYLESDTPNPINVYGESKLAGEEAIAASGCNHLLYRTPWVIGRDGPNFAKTILALACDRNTLNIVNDQFGVPTTPALIAKVTAEAIRAIASGQPWPVGLYHLAPRGKTTWFGIAQSLFRLARKQQLPLSLDAESPHACERQSLSRYCLCL